MFKSIIICDGCQATLPDDESNEYCTFGNPVSASARVLHFCDSCRSIFTIRAAISLLSKGGVK